MLTPAFIYDLHALDRHCRSVREALPPNCEMFYAVKANAELPLLRVIAARLDGLEVASAGELALVQAELPLARVLFGGPGKTDAELASDVEAFHVESLWELERLARRGTAAQVFLRVNPRLEQADSPMLMAGKPTPFGLDEDDLPPAFELLRQSPELDCPGFHLHTRSLQLSAEDHLRLMDAYFTRCRAWSERFELPLRVLNLGGGIGVNYLEPERQFPWAEFCRELGALIARHGLTGTKMRFECGRFITAFCGTYAVEVLDLKRSHGEVFAVCRGGTHHFRLPVAQGHSHPFQVVPGPRRPGVPEMRDVRVNVVGQLCTPKDRLATQAPVEHLAVGDVLRFPMAGAYGWNISHHDFLMHPHPEKVFS